MTLGIEFTRPDAGSHNSALDDVIVFNSLPRAVIVLCVDGGERRRLIADAAPRPAAIPEPEAPAGGVFFPRRLAARSVPGARHGTQAGAPEQAGPRAVSAACLDPVDKVVTQRTAGHERTSRRVWAVPHRGVVPAEGRSRIEWFT